jgi:hypothetical protein
MPLTQASKTPSTAINRLHKCCQGRKSADCEYTPLPEAGEFQRLNLQWLGIFPNFFSMRLAVEIAEKP